MKLMVSRSAAAWFFSGSQAKNISYSTDHGQKIFRTLPKRYFGLYLLVGGRKPYRLPITLASSLSPLNVPKTGFPWSIPPDLARLTPSDRYPELDNNNFSPCLGTFDPHSPKGRRRGRLATTEAPFIRSVQILRNLRYTKFTTQR